MSPKHVYVESSVKHVLQFTTHLKHIYRRPERGMCLTFNPKPTYNQNHKFLEDQGKAYASSSIPNLYQTKITRF